MSNYDYRNRPLKDLHWPTRITNALLRAGYEKVGDVFSLPLGDILDLRHVGLGTVGDAVNVSEQRGMAEIVQRLAEGDPPIVDGTYHNGHDWCVLCAGEGPDPKNHDEDCPWRMAVEMT